MLIEKLEVNEIENCKLLVKLEANPEQVDNKRNEVIGYFKNEDVPGFRKGKATFDVIKHHFKDKIEEVLKQELAQTAFYDVIAEKQIKPFGHPQFLTVFLDGSQFKCDFCVNKLPDLELKEYKGFDLPKGNIPNATEMSEKILEELRHRNGETVPFGDDDFVQRGDSVVISYTGYFENQEEPAIKRDGEIFTVGKSVIEDFNDNLLGMKVGEKREFTVLMPENTAATHLAGKSVKYIVELDMGSKTTPAPLDDSLANKVGAKDITELTSMVKGAASVRVQELERRHLADQVAARLVENHETNIPAWLTSFEAKLLAKQYGKNFEQLSDAESENLSRMANKNIILSLILEKIRETEPDAQMSDEEVISMIKNNLPSIKNSFPNMASKTDEEFLKTIQDSGYLPTLISNIKDDFVMDFLVKNSKVVE